MNEDFLKLAIDIAVKNVDSEGGPFGAVIVKDGKMIASSGNMVTANNDPTAHAEILAIRIAAEKLNTWDLSGCVLYASCEPCPMCLGAIYWAHVDKVCYSCSHLDAKNAGFDDSHIYDEIRLPAEERQLPMQQHLRDEGLIAFTNWKKKINKIKY